ncbi:MAG: acetate kinase [Erysipelotrichia bacterium]|nr:acetate kinase [Erysipelotrichia bacterium]NCC54843.1 acetate kinase [Erysipelotrichia bacterium]
MTKIISVNAGSSSLKFQLYEMPEEKVLTNGIVERIGFDDAIFTISVNGEKVSETLPVKDHSKAVSLLLNALVEHKIVNDLDEIKGAGHRIVHGGEYFSSSTAVDEDVEAKVEELCALAPLHNPGALIGYRAFRENLPHCKHTFTYDTAFHQTIADDSYIFAVPYEWYTDYKVRRYGAHGTSHQYVSERCAVMLGKDIKDTKIITCHLGGGASISAVDGGKCVNTSMGFTPLGGVMMGTRCGDIDPAIVPYMMEKLNCTPKEMDTYLNKKSGLLGVSGVSSDGRDISKAIEEGNYRADLALRIFVNRVVQTVGSYYAQLEGCDAIVFTAGIGENDCETRAKVCRKLSATLNIDFDFEKNDGLRGKEAELSKANSKTKVFLIPTNEEVMIARDCFKILGF